MLSKQQVEDLMGRQPRLVKQSYEDTQSLHTLSMELISRQATQNIGTIGHVAHGKSTLVKAISGVHTVKFHNEKIRNITIKLGYANSKIFKCPKCAAPQCYKSFSSNKDDNTQCKLCESEMQLQRHVSFVDCPGHDILMATMLTGAAVMDAALLLIAGNMSCPQPQTKEHLAAVEIMNLDHILIVQNKIDIIFKDSQAANKNYEEIKKFVQDTKAQDSPILPVSAQLQYNVDVVCQYLCEYFPVPIRDFSSSPKMIIIRSFDVNRPGIDIEQIQGGVAGGTILQGILRVGDEIEIRPGIVTKNHQGQVQCKSIFSRILSLKAENNDLLYAGPGGLIGCGLKVDPTLTRSDKLVGHVLGHPNKLPDVYIELEVQFYLLKRLLGVKSETGAGGQSQRSDKVRKIQLLETLMINVGSTQTGGKVTHIDKYVCHIQLVAPVCTEKGEKVALSRRIDKKWRLIGWGEINKGKLIDTNPQ